MWRIVYNTWLCYFFVAQKTQGAKIMCSKVHSVAGSGVPPGPIIGKRPVFRDRDWLHKVKICSRFLPRKKLTVPYNLQ